MMSISKLCNTFSVNVQMQITGGSFVDIYDVIVKSMTKDQNLMQVTYVTKKKIITHNNKT